MKIRLFLTAVGMAAILMIFGFFAFGSSGAAVKESAFSRKGLLLRPVRDRSRWVIEPGLVVRYMDAEGARGVRVLWQGKVYETYREHVYPMDGCVAEVVHLQACQRVPPAEEREVFFLIDNALRGPLRGHRLEEELSYRRIAMPLHTYDDEPAYSRRCLAIRDYLKRFPKGKYRDEVEWHGVRMPYGYKSGYEGYVRTILEAGAASLRLVEERPRHRFREYLIGRGALHFKMAAECETDAVKSAAFLRRSLTLLDGLKNSKDDLVRSAARYYLHAFRAGKNIYQNADIWSSGWYSLF